MKVGATVFDLGYKIAEQNVRLSTEENEAGMNVRLSEYCNSL